ncbi:MAG: hypothetical protein JXO51_01295 [Candidatus Aminicenantes bacterium]|nr:hypothetical protein [Candidatus Aminicenantes bacterium]
MKKNPLPLLLLPLVLACLAEPGRGCTTAVLSPAAVRDGRPMLWKNRDSDFLNNKVIFVRESPHSYLALVNAEDRSGRWAYAGLNDAGFAIFNSVAYNLPQHKDEMRDLEGTIMADALRRCASVEEFENYLRSSLGPSLGSLANFGVLDARGGAALFEVSNHAYRKFAAADFKEGYIVNTNFARSGTKGTGAGYLRHERAAELFGAIAAGTLSHRQILGRFSRDTGHALVRQPAYPQFKFHPGGQPLWICCRDTIDRYSTSAAVVVHGRQPGHDGSLATFWVMLGEPLFTIALPLWVEAGPTPDPLCQGGMAALLAESQGLKKIARPHGEGDRREYLDAARLDNREGSGFLPGLLRAEEEIFSLTEDFLLQGHSPSELAVFQNRMAERALAALRAAH